MIKVESYKIKGWKNKVTGVLVSENEHWILVKHIPVDYVIDGYKLYAKKFVKKREPKRKEKKIEKVLTLKKLKPMVPTNFKFGSASEMLNWVENKYGIFEFQDKTEDELFYGTVNSIKGNSLAINMIKSNGKVEEKYDTIFRLNKIRSITFMTDYFHSINLLVKSGYKTKE